MSKCDRCGEYVDWDNPNIHYGGHTCSKEIKSWVEHITNQQKTQEQKLTWHDVFDAYKLFPENYNSVIEYLKRTRYRYLAFNGLVYSVDDRNMQNVICNEIDL